MSSRWSSRQAAQDKMLDYLFQVPGEAQFESLHSVPSGGLSLASNVMRWFRGESDTFERD